MRSKDGVIESLIVDIILDKNHFNKIIKTFNLEQSNLNSFLSNTFFKFNLMLNVFQIIIKLGRVNLWVVVSVRVWVHYRWSDAVVKTFSQMRIFHI